MESYLKKGYANISQEGFAQWTLCANENFGSRDAVNIKKSLDIKFHCKQRFVSFSGINTVTQDDSDGENGTKKRKAIQSIKDSNLDTIDMTQSQNNIKKVFKKRRTRSSRSMGK